MKITLLSITPKAEKHIETCARICYQSEPSENYKHGTLIKNLIKSGHNSVLEHAVASFKIEGISRACSHQLVRHRLLSISQKSQRYVKESQFEYIIPESITNNDQLELYKTQMTRIQHYYNFLKSIGISNEDARMILPNACTTELITTANFREWRHIIDVRCEKSAQWEIKEMSCKILEILYNECANVFEDLYNKYLKNDHDDKSNIIKLIGDIETEIEILK